MSVRKKQRADEDVSKTCRVTLVLPLPLFAMSPTCAPVWRRGVKPQILLQAGRSQAKFGRSRPEFGRRLLVSKPDCTCRAKVAQRGSSSSTDCVRQGCVSRGRGATGPQRRAQAGRHGAVRRRRLALAPKAPRRKWRRLEVEGVCWDMLWKRQRVGRPTRFCRRLRRAFLRSCSAGRTPVPPRPRRGSAQATHRRPWVSTTEAVRLPF